MIAINYCKFASVDSRNDRFPPPSHLVLREGGFWLLCYLPYYPLPNCSTIPRQTIVRI
ncbi:hypothetical protein [Helicobacter sp. T3_23-1059]